MMHHWHSALRLVGLKSTLLFGVMALTQQPLFSQAKQNQPIFGHEVVLSREDVAGLNSQAYLGASGVVFLNDNLVVEYVLRANSKSLTQRESRSLNPGYILTLTTFDLDQEITIAATNMPVWERSFAVHRSVAGNLILGTQSWTALISPKLEILHQVKIDEQFGQEQINTTVDVSGRSVYLSGPSGEDCPMRVQVLDSESLLTRARWCLLEKERTAFFADTAIQYHEGRDRTLRLYRNGKQRVRLDLPDLYTAGRVVLLSDDWILAEDGGQLLSYVEGRGAQFSTRVLPKYNISPPLKCGAEKKACAMVLARSRPDFFDVAKKITFKDVLVAVVSLADGKVVYKQSIRNQYPNPSDIDLRSLGDARVAISPSGNRVAVWQQSGWRVYSVQ